MYVCRAGDCRKEFNRQDARLKHERNTHPRLCHPASQLRFRRNIKTPTADFVKEEPASIAPGVHSLRSLEDSSINVDDNDDVFAEGAGHDPVSNLSVAAWKTFYEIHAGLDSAKYSQLCNRLFTRWAALAQALKEQK